MAMIMPAIAGTKYVSATDSGSGAGVGNWVNGAGDGGSNGAGDGDSDDVEVETESGPLWVQERVCFALAQVSVAW